MKSNPLHQTQPADYTPAIYLFLSVSQSDCVIRNVERERERVVPRPPQSHRCWLVRPLPCTETPKLLLGSLQPSSQSWWQKLEPGITPNLVQHVPTNPGPLLSYLCLYWYSTASVLYRCEVRETQISFLVLFLDLTWTFQLWKNKFSWNLKKCICWENKIL